MKYKSKKGTTIDIPDGLTAKQIAAIKADADSGYGTRAQKTANDLGKALGKNSAAAKKTTVDNSTIVNKNDGTIDPKKAIEATRTANNQTITDQYGNKRIIRVDPDTGETTVTDEAGGTANTFKTLAEAAASTFNGAVSRKNAEEATYGTLTKYYDRDQAREMEDAKQELANRGIPYDPAAAQDPNTDNLYGKTIGGIGQKYTGLKADAANQSVLAGNAAYATDASTRDSFINAVTSGASTFGGQFQPYTSTSGEDTQKNLALSSAAFLAKYGIDKDTWIKQQAVNKQGSGGGGGGGKDTGGFEITT